MGSQIEEPGSGEASPPTPLIPRGHKYALVALPVHIDPAQPDRLNLSPGAHATKGLGFPLPAHWREWIGSIAADQLAEEQLCLWITAPTDLPGVLDGVNERLKFRALAWLRGLLLATPTFGTSGQLTLLTGANRSDGVDVRERSTPDRPLQNNGVPWMAIREGHIRESVAIGERIVEIHDAGVGKYRRLKYVVEGFYRGSCTPDAGERIHLFVRCVEGCILPPQGETKAKFLSRTELFLGPSEHPWASTAYDIRSAVEHLNDQLSALASPSPLDAALTTLRLAHEVQELARYCLQRLFTRRQLLSCFIDDAELHRFWSESPEKRRELWGEQLDLSKVREEFNPDFARIED